MFFPGEICLFIYFSAVLLSLKGVYRIIQIYLANVRKWMFFFQCFSFSSFCCLLSLIFCIPVVFFLLLFFCNKGLLSLLSYKVTGRDKVTCGRNMAATSQRGHYDPRVCGLLSLSSVWKLSVTSDLFWHSELTDDADARVHLSVGVSGFLTPTDLILSVLKSI